MKYLKAILFILVVIIFPGCANDMLGANMYIDHGGEYVERWYLNPEYNRKDIPTGTAFYGAAAKKVKDKFIVKYYIRDDKKSDVEIPISDMWIVNHNGKRWIDQDDDDLFYYTKSECGFYEKHKVGNSKYFNSIYKDRFIPIKSCDEKGWCKVYPNYYSNELYVKRRILKEPLHPEPHN